MEKEWIECDRDDAEEFRRRWTSGGNWGWTEWTSLIKYKHKPEFPGYEYEYRKKIYVSDVRWLLKETRHILTEDEIKLRSWECAICDKKFKAGDIVRSLYTNHEKDKEISGNPLVCYTHGTAKECKDILKKFAEQAKTLPKFIRRRYDIS